MIEESEIPNHWEIETIEDVLKDAKNGGTPRRSNDDYWGGEVPWLSSGEIRGRELQDAEEKITQAGLSESSAKLFPKDSVLVAMYGDGDTKGRSVINRCEISGNQAICCLVPDEKIISEEYLMYYIKCKKSDFRKLARGAGQDNLNQSIITGQNVPIPPLDEQDRIVEAVEERLERVERLEKSVENIRRLSSEYEDSIMTYTFANREYHFQGTVTQTSNGRDIPDDWQRKTVGEISTEIRTGGTPKTSVEKYWGGNIPWKASKHFNKEKLDINKTSRYVTESGKEKTTVANKGDVLLVCRGAHTGKVGIARREITFNQDVKVIRLPDNLDSKYVGYYLTNKFEHFKNMQRGGTTKGITTSHVESVNIPVPPLDKQKQIVDELERIEFSRIDKSSELLGVLFNEYRDSVLAHAFQGEYSSPTNQDSRTTPSTSNQQNEIIEYE